MSNKPYENREIDEFFKAMRGEQSQAHKNFQSSLDRIEAQTMKTNGRVSALEKWQAYVLGAVAILTIVVLPVVFQFIWNWMQPPDEKLEQALEELLTNYKIEVIE